MLIEKSADEQIEDLGLIQVVRPDSGMPASGKVSPLTRRNLLKAGVAASSVIMAASAHRGALALPMGGAFLYARFQGYSASVGQYWVEPNGACFNVWDSPTLSTFFDTLCPTSSGSISFTGIAGYFNGTISSGPNGIAGQLVFCSTCPQCIFF